MSLKNGCFVLILVLLVTTVHSFPHTTQLSVVSNPNLNLHNLKKICTPHNPIVITNESDFSDLGFSGDGSSSEPYLIQGLEISTTGDCISVSDIRANFTIKDCILFSESQKSGYGVLLDNSTSGTIEGCIITNKDVGVKLDHADFPSVERCNISSCRIGVYSLLLYNSSIRNNHIYDCSKYGICVSFSMYSEILENNVHDNDYCGIALSSSDGSIVANNTVYNHLYGSRNMFFDSFGGISLEWCDECRVVNNTIINSNEAGIYLYDLYNTTLQNNSISGGLTGIWTDRSYSCYMLENDLYNNSISDIFLDESDNCTLSDNLLIRGVLIEGFSWSQWNHTSNANVINEKQLVFFKGLLDTKVDCNAAGQLIVFNSSLLNVSNADMSGVCAGIQIGFSTNISAQMFNITNSSENSILVEKSTNLTLTDIIVTSSIEDGMKFSRCENITLNRCNISNCMDDAIEIEESETFLLRNVFTEDNVRTGLRIVKSSGDLVSIDNSFENGSVFFDSSSLMHISGEFDNSKVNGKGILYLNEGKDSSINGESYGQIFLRNCTNVSIQNGEFYGIQFSLSNGCRAENFRSMFSEVGVYISNSWNCTVSHAVIFGNYINGISILNCDTVRVSNCCVYDNRINGISDECSNNSEIVGNHVWNHYYGIDVDSSQYSLFSNNTLWNSTRGINMFESGNVTIVNETVYGCSNQGIRVFRTDFVNVSNSLVYNTRWGIEVWQAEYSTIIDNQILANFEVGIYLNQASRYCRVYNNSIGCNNIDAYDYGVDNSWDDEISVGNGWCNYSGSGVYDISGSAGSIDNYPTTIPPHLFRSMDIECELGHTGKNITWVSLCHRYFVMFQNDSVVKESTWGGMIVTASLDGLGLGVYNYTVQVNGSDGSWLKDTVFVTIKDTTAPIINAPEDIQYIEGASRINITWNPVDASPSSYELHRNDSLIDSGPWNGSEIVVMVDGLSIGTYNYSIIAYDSSGNHASDQVIVSVIPPTITTTTVVTTTTTITTDTTTTTTTKQETTISSIFGPDQILMITTGAGVLVVVLIIGVYYRKRR